MPKGVYGRRFRGNYTKAALKVRPFRGSKKGLFTLLVHFLQVEETSVSFIPFPTFYSNTISNSCVNTAFILKFLNDDTLQNPSGLVHHQAEHVQRSGSIGAFRLILCRWVLSVNLRPRMTSVSQIRMVMLWFHHKYWMSSRICRPLSFDEVASDRQHQPYGSHKDHSNWIFGRLKFWNRWRWIPSLWQTGSSSCAKPITRCTF